MISFASASVRIANSQRAVDECVDIAFAQGVRDDCRAVIFNAAMGHKLDKVAEALQAHLPQATILGTSCGGIVGREGAGEAMSNIAMMTFSGPPEEMACSVVDEICSENAYEKALALAKDLQEKLPDVRIIYLLCPGLDINCTRVLQAFEEVYGQDVVIFGGTSADNYRALVTYQYIGDKLTEHGAFALGIADKTLKVATRASHGFTPYGDPMVVTKAEKNEIVALDGMPSWAAYANRLSLIPEGASTASVIAAGALAERLPDELAAEYGSTHILRGAGRSGVEGVMRMSVEIHEGDEFWLTIRDEELIFTEQEKALEDLREQIGEHTPVAVMQADCLARGRTLFNKVMKDELIGMMQSALMAGDEVPPWLGMYGFGEFCPLGGKNTFHTYTTSLMVLYR